MTSTSVNGGGRPTPLWHPHNVLEVMASVLLPCSLTHLTQMQPFNILWGVDATKWRIHLIAKVQAGEIRATVDTVKPYGCLCQGAYEVHRDLHPVTVALSDPSASCLDDSIYHDVE
jgi:hypothetical protein